MICHIAIGRYCSEAGKESCMETIELKLLLKLLSFPDYRAAIAKTKPTSKMTVAECEEVCQKLCDRGLLACSYAVSRFQIAPPGEFLLQQDTEELPLTDAERQALQASTKGTITPEKTGIPSEERQTTIQNLAERGLIEVNPRDKKIQEIWLTERGKEYLQYEYNPSGTQFVLSLDLLNNYVQFLRESFRSVSPPPPVASHWRGDDKILLVIQELDRQLSTNNHLPIFNLREKLDPLLSREELDKALHHLEQGDKIKLSPLPTARASAFTTEQIEAVITQDTGKPLFFVSLK